MLISHPRWQTVTSDFYLHLLQSPRYLLKWPCEIVDGSEGWAIYSFSDCRWALSERFCRFSCSLSGFLRDFICIVPKGQPSQKLLFFWITNSQFCQLTGQWIFRSFKLCMHPKLVARYSEGTESWLDGGKTKHSEEYFLFKVVGQISLHWGTKRVRCLSG